MSGRAWLPRCPLRRVDAREAIVHSPQEGHRLVCVGIDDEDSPAAPDAPLARRLLGHGLGKD